MTVSLAQLTAGPGLPQMGIMAAGLALPVGPFTLIGLLVWFYLCLYTVHVIEIGHIIPRRWKTLGKLA